MSLKVIKVYNKKISKNSKTFFIADIAANHDGKLSRALKLIRLCAKAGADAAKFQHFKAETIVSDYGFKKIGKITHQKKWKKSIFEIYKEASINNDWTPILKKECHKNNIAFMTSPYDLEYVDSVSRYVDAYKIGSGDINWHEIVEKISKKNKPVMVACGASNLNDVKNTINKILKTNKKVVLMQCNTNYTNSENNFSNLNIKVLSQFNEIFKDKIILGLSDHTHGHTSVLGAVALGAKVIEKHFTDNNVRKGPDHKFSMNPNTWKMMVKETRRLELALGDGLKKIEKNEKETFLVQRRCVRANQNIKKGTILKKKMLIALRPNVNKSVQPDKIYDVINKKINKNIQLGEALFWKNIS
tara:strand:+ start:727 stop:1800 length:1074 start_codon:yes stop_codon:yes gene_type:complete